MIRKFVEELADDQYTFIKHPGTNEIHIFISKLNDNGSCKVNKSSCCKLVERESSDPVIEKCLPIHSARIRAAEIANEGNNVCGDCVGHLYKTEK